MSEIINKFCLASIINAIVMYIAQYEGDWYYILKSNITLSGIEQTTSRSGGQQHINNFDTVEWVAHIYGIDHPNEYYNSKI